MVVILCADGLGPGGYQDTIIEVPFTDVSPIFADGFESGNTSVWTMHCAVIRNLRLRFAQVAPLQVPKRQWWRAVNDPPTPFRNASIS